MKRAYFDPDKREFRFKGRVYEVNWFTRDLDGEISYIEFTDGTNCKPFVDKIRIVEEGKPSEA